MVMFFGIIIGLAATIFGFLILIENKNVITNIKRKHKESDNDFYKRLKKLAITYIVLGIVCVGLVVSSYL